MYLTSFIEHVVLLCFCIYFPDYDDVEVEICRRNMSDKLLFYWLCSLLGQILYYQNIARNIDCVAHTHTQTNIYIFIFYLIFEVF
jgi:hypothetical protein